MYRLNRLPSPPRFLVLCFLLSLSSRLHALNAVLSLEPKEVMPGEDFSMSLLANLDSPIRGFQVGFEFSQFAMSLRGATLDGTDISGLKPDLFEVKIGAGYGTVRLQSGVNPPYPNAIPAGSAVRLLRLQFRMAQGLAPGTAYPVRLRSGLGTPNVLALIFAGTSMLAPAAMNGADVKVIDQDVLLVRDLEDVRPGTEQIVEIAAYNIDPLQGFSISLKFDPAVIQVLGVDLEDTITEAVGAESIHPVIDNVQGQLVIGVLLDSMPPYQNQLIPATGIDMTIIKVRIRILKAPDGSAETDLLLLDGLGAPPIRNVFVVDNQSVCPILRSGHVSFLVTGTFIRGDVNGDGRLDISDPIATGDWIFRGLRPPPTCQKAGDSNDDGKVDLQDMVFSLVYLFQNKNARIPAPYPREGLDPTEDDLPCPP